MEAGPVTDREAMTGPWIEHGWTYRDGDHIVYAHVGADGYTEKRVYAPRRSWWRRLWEWLTR